MIKITFLMLTGFVLFFATPNVQSAVAKTAKTVVVTGKNFSFSPTKITLQKGKPVKIVFNNIEGFHDFRIEGMKVATKVIKTGEETSVTFTPNKKGKFVFYCSVGEHRALGMKGTLVVK